MTLRFRIRKLWIITTPSWPFFFVFALQGAALAVMAPSSIRDWALVIVLGGSLLAFMRPVSFEPSTPPVFREYIGFIRFRRLVLEDGLVLGYRGRIRDEDDLFTSPPAITLGYRSSGMDV